MTQDSTSPGLSRRAVLAAGIAGAAMTAAASAQPQAAGQPEPVLEKEPPLPEAERIGFAVVGLGKLALGEVLPAFGQSRAAKLVALVSGSPDKAKATAAQYGLPSDAIYDYAGFDRIADDPRIQVVYIILPNALHADYTIRALKAGKHVLCEKPMATRAADCEAMIKAASEAQKKLMIAYRAQFEPHNLRAIQAVRGGGLGDIKFVNTINGRPADPEDPADEWRLKAEMSGGGALFDIGIYGINGARYLTGEEPAQVRAWTFTKSDDSRFGETLDVVAWQLAFPSGVIANGSSSFSYAETSRLEVIGTKGRVQLDPGTSYRGIELSIETKAGEEQPKIEPVNQFAREMDHFALAIRDNGEVRSPGEEGLQDIRLMAAIMESVKSGQPVKTEFGYRRAAELKEEG